MSIVSLNAGEVKKYPYRGKNIITAIFKHPISGTVMVTPTGLGVDRQADPRYHGGLEKAIYCYPVEHYAYWKEVLALKSLPYGSFGENLTIENYLEKEVFVGDVFKSGNTLLQVTLPREPCYKLNFRFGNNQMVKLFNQSGRCGFYLSVVETGELEQGIDFEKIESPEEKFSISDYYLVLSSGQHYPKLLSRALELSVIPDKYKEYFQKQLQQLQTK